MTLEIDKTVEAVKDKTVQHEKKVKHDESVYSLECKMCEKKFDRFVDLEIHIKNCHDKQNLFECDKSQLKAIEFTSRMTSN